MRYYQLIINGLSTLWMRFYCNINGVKISKNVRFKRVCTIRKISNASIEIGEGTMLNSNNFGYHINMFKSCKILADRPQSNIKIGANCRIHGTCIHSYKSISIGNNVLIAANTQIIDGNGHQLSFDDVSARVNTFDNGKPIKISDNVWIGANCFILGGVTIGEGSVIAANSVVNKNIPPMVIAGGNPCVVLKNYV